MTAVAPSFRLALAGLAATTFVLVGCTSGSGPAASATATLTTATLTTTAALTLPGGGGETTTKPRSSTRHVVPTTRTTTHAPKSSAPAGKVREVNGTCPYISNAAEQVAEGKRVGRSTVLTSQPRGCRFYLAYGDLHAVAQITVKRYPTALAAFNTVARTGGPTAFSTPGIGDGAVLYRAKFYKPDGDQDWACSFAKGRSVVTVRTDENHSSDDARNVALAIVGKF